MHHVLSAGFVCGDLVLNPVDSLPPAEGNLFVQQAGLAIGGCAANAAVGFARLLAPLGGRSAVAGRVGVDPLGRLLRAGFRVLDIGGLPGLAWRELGYFDTVPGSNSIGHSGAFAPTVWPEGAMTISDVANGLFVLRPLVDWVYLPLLLRQ